MLDQILLYSVYLRNEVRRSLAFDESDISSSLADSPGLRLQEEDIEDEEDEIMEVILEQSCHDTIAEDAEGEQRERFGQIEHDDNNDDADDYDNDDDDDDDDDDVVVVVDKRLAGRDLESPTTEAEIGIEL